MDSDIKKWQSYQEGIKNVRPLVIQALPYVNERNAALDLGAGSLNDSEFLVQAGFKEVVAVDQTPQFKEIQVQPGSEFSYVQKRFDEYAFPSEHFDLISAQYALPFAGKDSFKKLWESIHDALVPGGIVTGQLFGVRDDWFGREGMVFHDKEEIRELMQGYEEICIDEKEYTESGSRKKHWHYFDLILRKID